MAQTSLSSYFHKVESSKGESANENEATEQTGAMGSGLRKLPPVELPATRGATKRASLQKNQTVVQVRIVIKLYYKSRCQNAIY